MLDRTVTPNTQPVTLLVFYDLDNKEVAFEELVIVGWQMEYEGKDNEACPYPVAAGFFTEKSVWCLHYKSNAHEFWEFPSEETVLAEDDAKQIASLKFRQRDEAARQLRAIQENEVA